MKFESRNSSRWKTIFFLVTFITTFLCSESSHPLVIKPDEIATVVGKALLYKLQVETTHSGYTFKLHVSGGDKLPSWLSFDEARNLLRGIPSHHDKGRHDIQIDVINDETNKTEDVINFLTIDVVQYDEDLIHYNALRPALVAQSTQNRSQGILDCPGHTPVIVATLVFDLGARKLSGAKRVDLLRKVSDWSDIDIDRLRFLPGKGDKTAFNLKDVIFLTAGPGWVKDAQERGVSVSWKIGCGENIAGSPFVIRLKSASETGEFEKDLGLPVVGWHVTHGMIKHRQIIRVRRQAPGQTPIPTSTFSPPTVSVVTRPGGVVGTPSIAPSPTVLTMTPTATRVSPSPMQVSPSPTRAVPPPVVTVDPTATPHDTPTPSANTPPRLINPVPDLIAEVDTEFRYPIPPNTFTDLEDGDTPQLTLDIHPMDGNLFPDNFWLKLDPKTQVLYGTPTKTGRVDLMLVATDKGQLKSEPWDNITINIETKNEPPRLINHIDLIKLRVGQPIKFPIPYDTFYDPEDGDTNNLTLAMTTIDGGPLPSWVTFDVQTRTIYALPIEQTGKPEFLMEAKDHKGKTARDAFEFHILPLKTKPNHLFGLVLDASFEKFKKSVEIRVNLCMRIGEYFGSYFNTSYNDIRVRDYKEGSVEIQWSFANIATDVEEVERYKEQYVIADSDDPVRAFEEGIQGDCPIEKECPVKKVYVVIFHPEGTTPADPNVVGRVKERGGGTWWKYTIIPAFVVAAVVFLIGLIIIICIRCRRKTKLEKKDKVVYLYRKKPAVFREEYPMKESYGDQPLITPSEKPPLPPPAYPRASTPTEDPSAVLLSHSSPSYQQPSFDNGPEQGSNARASVPSYRLPPPYVAP